MPPWLPSGWVESFRIAENGQNVSYLVNKIHQTTKIIDLDPSYGQNLDEIAYFDTISPLNGPGDNPVGELKFWK